MPIFIRDAAMPSNPAGRLSPLPPLPPWPSLEIPGALGDESRQEFWTSGRREAVR